MNAYHPIYISAREQIFEALEAEAVNALTKDELSKQLANAIDSLVDKNGWTAAAVVRTDFVKRLVDELRGLGPLQPLIEDDSVSDVMVNGYDSVFVERKGKIESSPVSFIDETQLINIAKRIVGQVGRRVDESSPTCDARLPDGSRVNVVIPPIALDGTSISIRKFRKQSIDLKQLIDFEAMTSQMASLLMIAARCRLNILISGGTGSGKTTLLNSLFQYVNKAERIVTIEDAAELRLLQPHVVRLETRASGVEGTGSVTQRELVINALRMRPDRIIVGECRGGEAFEMLQAMNTGHDGSMSTLHANTPRDALSRVESMVMMANTNLPLEAIRRTIVSAVDLIVQVSRLHDGSRKITSISEVVGIEGQNVVLEEIFRFQPNYQAESEEGKVKGEFVSNGLMQRSVFQEKARFFGLVPQLSAIFHKEPTL
ncbi:pilus assembly protein CpaF [Vibrio splendidus]|uniref:Pilus assembly protein CpaF n=3 Tax=Vibrio lentus TaxID=136468 RepID=A0A2J6UH10_9VIBR|nr:CpaF family protein [Vibrio lentus]PHN83517.1 pilus assembly protein CpaF [Vibrio splendidus]MCB5362010.1 CpaF family protein [Vibrio lentus]MCB5452345.1 CpaF family protein [Vibrio lentus]MCB5464378.1 CpaF family protein [Vibrio lentus]MCB5464514.1 CpaF family protein [Vibrio lentus]